MNYLKNYKNIIFIFIILFIFSLLVPLSGDDYTFLAYSNGIVTLTQFLEAQHYMYINLNGRLLGNGLELLLVGKSVLSAAVRAVIVTLLVQLVVKLVRPNTKLLYLVTISMTLLVPVPIMTQTYLWQAGFFNYVTSTLFVVAGIYLLNRYSTKAKVGVLGYAYLVLVALAGSLFAENVTVVGLGILMTLAVFYVFKKDYKRLKLSSASLIGALIGSFIMFSSPVYRSVASGSDDYRSVVDTNVGNSVVNSASDIITHILGLSALPLVLLLSIGSLLIVLEKRNNFNKDHTLNINLVSGILIFYPIWVLFSKLTIGGSLASANHYLRLLYMIGGIVITICYIVAICLIIKSHVKNNIQMNKSLSYVALSFLFILPFLILSPFGPRNFLLSYILLLIAGLIVVNGKYSKKIHDLRTGILYFPLVSLGIMLMGMLTVNKVYEGYNMGVIHRLWASDTVENEVTLKRMPFKNIVHDANSAEKIRRYASKLDCQYTSCTVDKLDVQVLFE